jgi:hypothetical protein
MTLAPAYRTFALLAAVVSFPCAVLGGQLPAPLVLPSAIMALLLDGLLTSKLLKSGGTETNPFMMMLARKVGPVRSILISRAVGILSCFALALLGTAAAVFLVFIMMTVACSIDVLEFARTSDLH